MYGVIVQLRYNGKKMALYLRCTVIKYGAFLLPIFPQNSTESSLVTVKFYTLDNLKTYFGGLTTVRRTSLSESDRPARTMSRW